MIGHNFTENNNRVLGILFYGSRNQRDFNSYSDIDLLIVTDDTKNYKGVTFIDNIKIEYFEKKYIIF